MTYTIMRTRCTVVCGLILLGGSLQVLGQARTPKLEPARAENESVSEKVKEKEFRVVGQGSSEAKIVDKTGKIFVEAEPSSVIYDCEVSPDGTRLVIYYLRTASRIMEIKSQQTRQLPQKPPGEHKFNFSAWHWIDNDRLIATSGDQKLDEYGRRVKHDDNVSQSRLYVYYLRTQELSEISLPGRMQGKAFSIGRINKSGLVLLNIDNENPDTTSKNWFRVPLP